MRWRVPRMWEGGEVWIIGGGPSVPIQFKVPQSTIQQVMKGASPSLYSPYMEPIYGKHVIGVNAAFLIGDWMDICFFGDKSFFKRYGNLLLDYPGMKVTCNLKFNNREVPWLRSVYKDKRKPIGISDNPKTVSWNHNSGAAAISVAANTGAKRIILVGFDMNLIDGSQWWHTIYTKGRKARDKVPFTRHLRGFPQIAKDAKKRGIKIINASPNSAIDAFEKCSVEELI